MKSNTRVATVLAALGIAGCSYSNPPAPPFSAADLPENLYLLPSDAIAERVPLSDCQIAYPSGSRAFTESQLIAITPLGVNDLNVPLTNVSLAREFPGFAVDVAFSPGSRTLSRFAPEREAGASDVPGFRWSDLVFAKGCGTIDIVNVLDGEPIAGLIFLTDDVACRLAEGVREPNFESEDDCMPRSEFDEAVGR